MFRNSLYVNQSIYEMKETFIFQGSVAFSEETGDRIAWTKVEQMQSNKYEVVAYYVSYINLKLLYFL